MRDLICVNVVYGGEWNAVIICEYNLMKDPPVGQKQGYLHGIIASFKVSIWIRWPKTSYHRVLCYMEEGSIANSPATCIPHPPCRPSIPIHR